jgi:hypothetical protein
MRSVAGLLRADSIERWSFGIAAGTEVSMGYEWWFTGREETTVEAAVLRHHLPEGLLVVSPEEVLHGR